MGMKWDPQLLDLRLERAGGLDPWVQGRRHWGLLLLVAEDS